MQNTLGRSLALLSSLLFTCHVHAVNWDSGGSTNLWNDSFNWDSNTVPTATDTAWLNGVGNFAIIDGTVDADASDLIVARHSGITEVVLDVRGGTLDTSSVIFIGQYAGSSGILQMSGGTITTQSELAVGVSGAGYLDMTGGTINVATSFKVGRYNSATAVAHVDLHGGVINCLSFNINDYSSMDIANNALLVIDGNESSNVNNYIAAGRLTAAGGAGTVDVDYDVTYSGKTTVTSSAVVSFGASDPIPSNGAVDVARSADLSWTASQGVLFDVYMGTSLAAVENADINSAEYIGTVGATTVDPGALERGITYYWRVDELDNLDQVLTTGDVWSFTAEMFDLNDRGTTTLTYDFTGVRSIPQAPAPGIHPRVFFSADEIPDILNRLQNTASGQAVSAQINAYMTLMDLGYSSYNQNASYALDAQGRRYIDNGGLYDSKAHYDALVAGTADPLAGADHTRRIMLCGQIALRAFWSLVHNDTADLSNVGTAIANLAPELDVYGDDYQCFVHLAYAYDFAYNEMSAAERAVVVSEIEDHLNGFVPYGTYEEAYATTSNWTALTSFWQLAYMAVEGESPTLDTLVYEGGVRAFYNFMTYGWYPSGAGYEGLGKNYMYATSLIAFARRGETYLGHPYLRAFAEDFLPATMQPFGYAFSAYDSLGGTGYQPDPVNQGYYKFNAHDAIGLKWIYPNSPEVDFVWRNYVGDDYDYRAFAPRGYDNQLLHAAIFVSDYADTSAWDSSVVPLSYYAGDRGLMHTRSDTTQDAMSLQFHARQDLGGHTNADRLNFNVSALGRAWAVYRTEVSGGATGNPHEMKYHSNVMIDDTGILVNNKDGVKARQPSKIVSYSDSPDITSVVGDATYAYAWEYDWSYALPDTADSSLSQGWTAVQETYNDFRVVPGADDHLDIPFYDLAAWTGYPFIERIVKRPNLAVDYVYRAASLVRGDEPYVLIVDDVAMTDGQSHNYKWQMQLVDDLTIESTDVNLVDSDYRCDIILKEPDTTGDRRLLVRVLQNDGYTGTPGYILNRAEPRYEVKSWPALVVEANTAADPNFKVLLFPHRDGDTLPTTTWNGTELTYTLGTQSDVFSFSETNGQTSAVHSRPSSDTTAPAAPVSIVATAGDTLVDIDWADNGESDFASYSVYRSTTAGSNYTAIATGLTASSFSDSTVVNDTTYYYVVTAIDQNSNESVYSSESSATPALPAMTLQWDNGASDSLWTSVDNWNQNFVPRDIDDVWVNVAGDYVLIDSTMDLSAKNAIFARHGGQNGIVVDMTGGDLDLSGVLFVGQYGTSHGTLNMSGGSISADSEIAIAVSGGGTLNMTGGSISTLGNFKVGRYESETTVGHVSLDGGSITCNYFSINVNCSMDVSGGTLVINGNRVSNIDAYVQSGALTAFDGAGAIVVDYDTTNPGQTTVTAVLVAPDAVANVGAVAGDNLVDLDWDDSSAAGTYSVYRSTTSGSGYTLLDGSLTVSQYSDSSALNDTTYYYVVTVTDSNSNESENSSEVSATPTAPAPVWTVILSDDFESGFGNWTDGGTDSILYTSSAYAHQGSNAIDLQDGTTTSTMTTGDLAVSTSTELTVDFWYYPRSMDNSNEGFVLEISTDGGASYALVQEWRRDADFANNTFNQESVLINGYTLTDQTRIRFRCDASGNADDVYIDEVVISAN